MYIASKKYRNTRLYKLLSLLPPLLLPCPHRRTTAAPIANTALLPMPLPLHRATATAAVAAPRAITATAPCTVAAAAPHTIAATALRTVAAAAAAPPHGQLWTWSVVIVVVVIGCRWLLVVVVVIVSGCSQWSLLSLPLSLLSLSLLPLVVGQLWSIVVVGHGHDCDHHATCHGHCTPPQPHMYVSY